MLARLLPTVSTARELARSPDKPVEKALLICTSGWNLGHRSRVLCSRVLNNRGQVRSDPEHLLELAELGKLRQKLHSVRRVERILIFDLRDEQPHKRVLTYLVIPIGLCTGLPDGIWV